MSETFASFFRLRALNGVAWRFVVMPRPSLFFPLACLKWRGVCGLWSCRDLRLVFRLRVFLQIQLFAKLGAFYE